MHRFPRSRFKLLACSRVSPSFPEVRLALLGDPETARLLVPPGPAWAGAPGERVARREWASRRLVALLEAHDPLFAPTVNLLFDVAESWPPRLEKAFWSELSGNAGELLDAYAQVRELVEDELFPDGPDGLPLAWNLGRNVTGGHGHGR